MGDPIEKKEPVVEEHVEAKVEHKAPDVPKDEPLGVTPASSLAEVAGHNAMVKLKAKKQGTPTAIVPGGIMIDAVPFVKARSSPYDVRNMLGNGEAIVSEKFKREHPGWQYEWPIFKSEATSAFIRSGRYKKVPFDAIDHRNPNAMVMEGPTGEAVWKQHVLVAVSPQVYYEDHTLAEHESIRQTAMNRAAMENELTQAFGRFGFKGEATITDVRQER
jgi:hypothetical protein